VLAREDYDALLQIVGADGLLSAPSDLTPYETTARGRR
jgi:hypothetical protein